MESAFSLRPPVSGAFAWPDDSRSFAYRHDTPFDPAIAYVVRLLGTAHDAAGGTLDGDHGRTLQGSPADDLRWTFCFPVANGHFDQGAMDPASELVYLPCRNG